MRCSVVLVFIASLLTACGGSSGPAPQRSEPALQRWDRAGFVAECNAIVGDLAEPGTCSGTANYIEEQFGTTATDRVACASRVMLDVAADGVNGTVNSSAAVSALEDCWNG